MTVQELIYHLSKCPSTDNVEIAEAQDSQYVGYIDATRPESDGEGITVLYCDLGLSPWSRC